MTILFYVLTWKITNKCWIGFIIHPNNLCHMWKSFNCLQDLLYCLNCSPKVDSMDYWMFQLNLYSYWNFSIFSSSLMYTVSPWPFFESSSESLYLGQSTWMLSRCARAPDMMRSPTIPTSMPWHQPMNYRHSKRFVTSTSNFITTAPFFPGGIWRVATYLLMYSDIRMTGTVLYVRFV